MHGHRRERTGASDWQVARNEDHDVSPTSSGFECTVPCFLVRRGIGYVKCNCECCCPAFHVLHVGPFGAFSSLRVCGTNGATLGLSGIRKNREGKTNLSFGLLHRQK